MLWNLSESAITEDNRCGGPDAITAVFCAAFRDRFSPMTRFKRQGGAVS